MKLTFFIRFFILSTFFISIPLGIVHAQASIPNSIDGVEVSMSPENPSPNQNVTITAKSYLDDLNKAVITWLADRKSFAKGVGLTSVDIPAPATGKTVEIMIVIDPAGGAEIRKVVTLKSGDVDLVWETGGFAPPFYRGKIPFIYQNYLKITAVPHFIDASGKAISPKNLAYAWKQDTTALQDQSGFGKDSITIKGNIIPHPFTVSVEVSSMDSKAHGASMLQFEAIAPSISFYEDDPLYGVLYNTAVGNTFHIFNSESKIISVPYGFNINSPLSYTWNINGTDHDELSQNRSITLKVNSGDKGKSDISLDIKNVGDDILESAKAEFSAVFNGTQQKNTTIKF